MMRRFLFGFMAVVLIGASLQAKEFAHPSLKKRATIGKVVILPPIAAVTKSGMKGEESMVDESDQLAVQLGSMVEKSLTQRGIEVQASPFAEEELKDDETVRFALTDLQSRYDNLAEVLHRKLKDVKKGRFSLGDELAANYPGALPDVLVFIRTYGTVLTGGKKTFGWLVTGAVSDNSVSYISFVDAVSGDVLFVSRLVRAGNVAKNPEKVLAKAIAKSFRKLPAKK